MTRSVNIVGVDPSLTGTALATGKGTQRVRVGTLRGCDRLIAIRDEVLRGTCDANLVVLENYAFASGNQAHQIGELGGVLRVGLWEAGTPVITVAPMTRAKFATGKGNSKKDEVMSHVSARTGIVFSNNDECDAFILRCMGLAAYGIVDQLTAPLVPTNQPHRDALCSVEWPTVNLGGRGEIATPVVEYVPPKKKGRKT